jgi:hypothetical protein
MIPTELEEIVLRPEDGLLDLGGMAARSRSGRPTLGSFSACSNVTGLLHRRHGAYACSALYVRVDMRSGTGSSAGRGARAYVLAIAKRMYSLGGGTVLYVSAYGDDADYHFLLCFSSPLWFCFVLFCFSWRDSLLGATTGQGRASSLGQVRSPRFVKLLHPRTSSRRATRIGVAVYLRIRESRLHSDP